MRVPTAGRYRFLMLTLSFVVARAMLGGGAGALLAQRPDLASAAEREVRVAEAARFRAMTHTDFAALDTLLGSDLSYTHSDGARQNRSELVAMLRSGALAYIAVQPESAVVRVYGTTALADGRGHMRVRSEGKELAFTIRFLEAYVRRRGRWELVAWQSTRLTPSGG
jgi:hypothetical protein